MKRKKRIPKCYTGNSINLLKRRFLKTNKKGKTVESISDLFQRVAKWVASADSNYTDDTRKINKTKSEFYEALYNLRFIPQSPTLINAGKKDKTLSACFVLPIQDSLDSIYKTLSDSVQIQWKGGGTGFNFSEIRPKGDEAGGIPDVAAGPIHFIKTFSEALMGIRQGGKRGGGNMAILNIDHPDILEFIHMKENDSTIKNFNISVGITDRFMDSLKNDENYDLINPRNNDKVKSISARYIFNEIVELAHRTGDPGIAFLDNIEKDNPTPTIGRLNATNPCGEQPLLPYESCNLAAVNLRVHFDFRKKELNFKKLRETIHTAVHFLDNIIDVNYYPFRVIEEMTRHTNRKMGLGIMGFADILILKEISYNSDKGVKYAEKIMKFIQDEAIKASINLAKERGTFPAYKNSSWKKRKLPVRNATITTIAPNGNTSIIGGSTGGIEPVYSLVYKIAGVEDKNYKATQVLVNENQAFKYIAKKYKFYSQKLVKKLAENTEVEDIDEIPDKVKQFLVTAHDIEPIWHLRMQAAFQKHVDNAISKTINFPNDSTTDDIRDVFIEAYKNHLKGVTIYRDGCKDTQTYVSSKDAKLNIDGSKSKENIEFVISSRDKDKIREIKSFLESYNGTFKIYDLPDSLNPPDIESKVPSEKSLLTNALNKAKEVALKTKKIAISDETGFLVKKKISDKSNILYYGKNGNYSKVLYSNILKNSKNKGLKSYISTALVVYDPLNKHSITTATKIPGKLVKISNKRYDYVFIHEGLESFLSYPGKEDFKSFDQRYKALQKIFDTFLQYRKDSIDIKLTPNAYQVLEKRSLKRDSENNIIETPGQLFRRIAEHLAKPLSNYKYSASEIESKKQKYYNVFKNLEIQCGGALIWAGMSDEEGKKAVLSKCFVLPVDDSIKSIFDTLNDNIEVLKHGGGTGFNFSKIRSTFAKVTTTGENAAGPVEYLRVYNRSQDTIIGRGGRQMGSMAVLNIEHPDIIEFIKAKDRVGELTHYNLSIGITSDFMKSLKENGTWSLIDPHDGKTYKTIKARKLFNMIAKHAWQTGDPGLLFLDEMQKHNPTPHLGTINATNPCGEQPLLPYESCNLLSINLSKIIKGFPYLDNHKITKMSLASKYKYIDIDKLKELIFIGVEILDNIIDINNYPIPEIEDMTKNTRSIGLGIMGFADLLVKLGISYGTDDSIKIARRIMKIISETAHEASKELGKIRGNFPSFKGSIWNKKRIRYMRNSRCTTVAPTGTISIVANCNPGIEPIFSLVFKRTNSLGGQEQLVIEPLFKKVAKQRGFYSKGLMRQLSENTSISKLKNIPKDVIDIFKTSHDIDPKDHVRVQSAFQKHCDSGVSKTINLPNNSKVKDIKNIFQLAYDLKCKGITIFREGCRRGAQMSSLGEKKEELPSNNKYSVKKKKPRPRPETTRGVTTQVKTDQGSLYVTINEDNDGIAEVFLNIGKSGGYSSGYCEAIGRLISVSLRAGLSLEAIIDQLKGIRTSSPTLNKGMFVYSVPDAVAKVLESYLKDRENNISMLKETKKIEIKTEKEIKNEAKNEELDIASKKNASINEHDNKYSNENKLDMLPECPDCGADLQYAEGCMMCQSCGYSKCG